MYRKNTAGQFVCFQMLLTATGAVATGLSPAVRRCLDGTFAAGGGTVTEDSAGVYKYAMAQADTNANDCSFMFSAATAMPVCVNIVTTAADPTDSVRLGLTGLANAVPGAAGGLFIAGTNAATTVTTSLTATFTGNLTGSVGSVTGAVGSVTGSVGSVTGAVGSVTAPVTVGTNNDKTGYSLTVTPPTANQNADALLDRTDGVETGRTLRQGLRLMLAAMAGKLSGAATTTVTIRDTNDGINRIVATVDSNGNRSAVTLDAS